MHDDIRKFYLEGTLGEPNIVETKERLVSFVENSMRDYGFVPALDLEPQFTLDYDAEGASFDFQLTVYGVSTKKEDAWTTSGVMSGKMIPKHTALNK